ncbi:hypothetical protein GCM10008090_33070 [Arenicella chitinivorans]|uniref:Uncharacterized protein n=1 Tax=Arenicella chitinivorans TaxID=1329800 RepID=A0A918VSJ0_9GAMM|nr:hypothetical protein GCM10008090_33070 [Arenicella chitinivorans]
MSSGVIGFIVAKDIFLENGSLDEHEQEIEKEIYDWFKKIEVQSR